MKNKMKLQKGHFYKFNDRGEISIGEYMGTENDFECCVCGKGHKAHCFNIHYNENDYETWGYGREHLPELLEDLGTELIINK